MYFNIALNLIIILLIVTFGFKNKRKYLFLISFLIPLQAISIDIGILVSWYKIIFPISAIIFLFKYKYLNRKGLVGNKYIILFLIYISILTIISWLYNRYDFLIASDYNWGLAQSKYRYFVQYFTYLFIWGIIFIPFCFVTSKKDFESIYNGYINGSLFSIIVGFYQILYGFIGLPKYELLLGWSKTPISSRLYGLGGEPKHTATFTLYAIIILITCILIKNNIKIKYKYFKFIILILGLILTASASGLFAFTIIFIFLLLLFIFRIKYNISIKRLFPLIVIILLVIIIVGTPYLSFIIKTKLIHRLGGGLSSISYYEYKDEAYYAFIKDNPLSLIFGFGTGGIDFKLIKYVRSEYLLERGGTITPTYFITRILGDIGIIGMLIIIKLFLCWKNYIGTNRIFKLLFILFFITLLLTPMTGLPAFLILTGAIIYYIKSISINKLT